MSRGGTREVLLSRGHVAIVDEQDYEWITSLGKWSYHGAGYAYRFDRTKNPHKCLLMHRLINDTPEKLDTDHINRNKLDNRRSNLRSVSRHANTLNRVTSGVESSKHWSGYCIRMCVLGERLYFGRYEDKEEAMHISKTIKEQLLEAIV